MTTRPPDPLDLFEMTNEQWEAWQLAEREGAEQKRADLIRVRGFAMALCTIAGEARERLDKAIAKLERAKKSAERELAKTNAACALAERWGTFASRAMAGDADPEAVREAATALEELVG